MVLGTSLLIVLELRVLVLTKRHVGSGNEIAPHYQKLLLLRMRMVLFCCVRYKWWQRWWFVHLSIVLGLNFICVSSCGIELPWVLNTHCFSSVYATKVIISMPTWIISPLRGLHSWTVLVPAVVIRFVVLPISEQYVWIINPLKHPFLINIVESYPQPGVRK